MATRTPKEIEQQIVELYNNGIGTNEIALRFDICRATVRSILKRNDIAVRKNLPWKNKYNIHFFDTFTPASCYWAGFIAADGNIHSNRDTLSIKLANADYRHLEKFAAAIEYTGSVKQNNLYCYIDVNGKWFVDSLRDNFNIVPNKSLILEPPIKIPNNLIWHYIRGYFDGDGCITQSNGKLHVSFASGSNKILEYIRDVIYNNGIKVRKTKNNNTEKSLIQNITINYFCENALNILKLLYNESNENIYLDRKYKKFLEFYKRNN